MPDLPHLIEEAVDLWVESRYEERPPDGKWHPSTISSRCARQSIYSIRGTPPSDKRGARMKRVLEVGKLIHTMFQDAVELHPAVAHVYHEVRIHDENGHLLNAVPTVGNSDDLVEFTNGTWELQEYKSKSSNMMRTSKQREELPEVDHLIQLKLYCRAIRANGFRVPAPPASFSDMLEFRLPYKQYPPIPDLTLGRVAYIGKDTAQIAETLVLYQPEIDEPMLDARLRYLEAYRQDGEALPPRLPLVTKHPKGKKAYTDRDWLCGGPGKDYSCPFYNRCWDEDPDEIPLYTPIEGPNPFAG